MVIFALVLTISTIALISTSLKERKLDWEQLSAWGTVTAAAIAAFTYKDSVTKSRKLDTINEIIRIREEFPNMWKFANKSDQESKDMLLAYLRKLERFSVGVIEGIYDINIVSMAAGALFITQFDNFMENLIEERKIYSSQQINAESYYTEYILMIKKLKKLRGKKVSN